MLDNGYSGAMGNGRSKEAREGQRCRDGDQGGEEGEGSGENSKRSEQYLTCSQK